MKNWKSILLGITLVSATSASHAQSCKKLSDTVRISAVGDILVHKAIYESVMKSKDRFRGLWARLTPQLKDADLTVGNLEGPVAPGTAPGGKNVTDPGFRYDGYVYSGTNFLFNYHPFLIDDLVSSGFDLVTTANNHAMDRGALGADRTVDQLTSRNLQFAGSRKRGGADTRARIVQVKSFKIGIVSCTEDLNGHSDKEGQILSCDSSAVISLIVSLRQSADGVIVFPHWGDEYEGRPNSGQRSLAKKWVSAGAAAVIGNHPHVLQTTEWIPRSSGGNALVIYSLGNFVAGQAPMERRVSAIAHLDLGMGANGLEVSQFSYNSIVRPSGSASLDYTRTSEEYNHVRKQLGPIVCK